MITLYRTYAETEIIPKAIKLNGGGTVFLKAEKDHRASARVIDEDDAQELERRGWERDAASMHSKAVDNLLLRKGLETGLARMMPGAADPNRKRELGEVEINLDGKTRRIRVSHDPLEGTLNLHGVQLSLSEIHAPLRNAFVGAASSLIEMQGRAEQAQQVELIGALLDRVLARHKFAFDALVRQLDHERFTAV